MKRNGQRGHLHPLPTSLPSGHPPTLFLNLRHNYLAINLIHEHCTILPAISITLKQATKSTTITLLAPPQAQQTVTLLPTACLQPPCRRLLPQTHSCPSHGTSTLHNLSPNTNTPLHLAFFLLAMQLANLDAPTNQWSCFSKLPLSAPT